MSRIHRISDSVPGHMLCCICMTFTKIADLYVDADGDKWDMCVQCGTREATPQDECKHTHVQPYAQSDQRPWCVSCGLFVTVIGKEAVTND